MHAVPKETKAVTLLPVMRNAAMQFYRFSFTPTPSCDILIKQEGGMTPPPTN